MATSNGKFDAFMNQVLEIKKIYFDELDHLVENCRWLTTLVMAEIGGIAAYRQLSDESNISLPFALIISVLVLTIICFMVGVFISRYSKKEISTLITKNIDDAKKIDGDLNIAPNVGDRMMTEINMNSNPAISNVPKHPRLWESIGIVLFILGSISTTLILIFYEILESFGF